MSKQKRRRNAFWNALAGRVLHETQVRIIEAMCWIDQPMSATELVKVFFERPSLGDVAYHIRRLHDLGFLVHVETQQKRGRLEKRYCLAEVGEQ
jgi:predicted ArsR family transcriptional regulator